MRLKFDVNQIKISSSCIEGNQVTAPLELTETLLLHYFIHFSWHSINYSITFEYPHNMAHNFFQQALDVNLTILMFSYRYFCLYREYLIFFVARFRVEIFLLGPGKVDLKPYF